MPGFVEIEGFNISICSYMKSHNCFLFFPDLNIQLINTLKSLILFYLKK